MKIVISTLLLFVTINLYSKASQWQMQYNLVLNDIKSVEKLGSRELSLRVRLFELYGEKLNLLIEKENEYKINSQKKGMKKAIDSVIKIQKETLYKMETMAKVIERQTKDRGILAKINYYRALNYYVVKDYKNFYKNIKKAEKVNKDPKRAIQIYTKLADYHFNEKQFPQSIYYYEKLKKVKNSWRTKVYYNLSWSYLKTEQTPKALAHIKLAWKLEQSKKFFKLGDQLVDSMILFYAYSKKTKEGLSFLQSAGLINFDNLLRYAKYIFDSGDKRSVYMPLELAEKLKLSADQKYNLLKEKIFYYRGLKQFSKVQKEFGDFKRNHKGFKRSQVSQKTREDLIKNIKGYTGYLQELVKSSNLISRKIKMKYIQYIAYNFSVLKFIDPANTLEYSFYEGETYFSIENFKRAALVYAYGINQYKKSKSFKPNNSFLVKSFDGLFKSLENDKRPMTKILLFSFTSYLDVYPKGPKSNIVYQRLLSHYQKSGDSIKMLNTLSSYNKNFPNNQKIQRDFYRSILNTYIDKKNIPALQKLKTYVDKKFLGFTKVESEKISRVITEIYFSKYDEMAKKGDIDGALNGFVEIYRNPKNKYDLRVEAIRKKMFYEEKHKRISGLAESVSIVIKFYRQKTILKNKEEVLYYTQRICDADMLEMCKQSLEIVKANKFIALKKGQENLLFRVQLALSENFTVMYKRASSMAEKNLVFKYLSLEDKDFKNPLFKNYYTQADKKQIIDAIVEKRFYKLFYSTLDVGEVDSWISNIQFTSLRNNLRQKLDTLKRSLAIIQFNMPKNPSGDVVTESQFASYGEGIAKQVELVVSVFQTITKKTEPNFLPYALAIAIAKFEKVIVPIRSFIPVSKNAELENAMSEEMNNFNKYFDQQLTEFRSLYYKTISNTSDGIRAHIYKHNIMSKPLTSDFGVMPLWIN